MRRRTFLVITVLVAILLAGAVKVAAQEVLTDVPDEAAATDDPVFRGSVTVTDTPIVEGNEIDRHAQVVTTVSRQQIDDLNAQDLASALRRVPGVVISRYNVIGAFGGGDGGAIFIRGHGSGRPGAEITTLVDGIPRFVGIWTHPLLDPMSLDPTGHVSVYRSPQPVLVGNMAFGAVDQVTMRRAEPGAGGRFVGSWGSYDTLVSRLEYAGRSDALDYSLTGSYRSSDGHRDNADGEVGALSGRVAFRLGEAWELALQVQGTSSDVNDPGRDDQPPQTVVQSYATDSLFSVATLGHNHGPWTGELKLYLDDLDADWLQWDGVAGEEFVAATRSDNHGAHLRETVAPWAGGQLILGVDHDIYGGSFVERRPSGDRSATDLSFRNTAPYVMLSHELGGAVKVVPSAGVRYNDSRFFGNQWGYQAGLKLAAGDWAAYANVAHGFNLPGVYAAVMYGGWGRGEQWQRLEPETVDHVEVGGQLDLGRGVGLGLSLFQDEVADAIRFVPPPPPPPQLANIGDYTVRGAELSLEARLGPRTAAFLGATYNETTPDDVPNLPELTAVCGLATGGHSGWKANLDLEYMDERFVLNPRFSRVQEKVGSYLLVNGRFGLPLGWVGLPGQLFVAGENLTDVDYEYRPGYPMPGRMWTLGLEVGF